jgi:hypothetical protein
MTLSKTLPTLRVQESLTIVSPRPALAPPGVTKLRLERRNRHRNGQETGGESLSRFSMFGAQDKVESTILLALTAGVLGGLAVGWTAGTEFAMQWAGFVDVVRTSLVG